MLVPVELHLHKENKTLLINVDTERMYDRIAEMLVDAKEGRRNRLVVMSASDMNNVQRASVTSNSPVIDKYNAVQVIDHGSYTTPNLR